VARRLVETERNLIQALGTAATDEEFEYKFWFSDRGTQNSKRLQEILELISAGCWLRAEENALALCQEQPDWAEPFNRLATLYYLMGRYDESVDLCEKVLSLKPHHFGALSGIIMCHLQRGDAVAAEHWASLNLPNMRNCAGLHAE